MGSRPNASRIEHELARRYEPEYIDFKVAVEVRLARYFARFTIQNQRLLRASRLIFVLAMLAHASQLVNLGMYEDK